MSKATNTSSKPNPFSLRDLLWRLNHWENMVYIASNCSNPEQALTLGNIMMFQRVLPDYIKAFEEAKKAYEKAIKETNSAEEEDSAEKKDSA